MNRISLAVVCIVLFLLPACSTRPELSNLPSEGMPGEILVVAEEDALEGIKEAFESQYQVVDSTLLLAEKADQRKFEKKHTIWFARDASFEGIEKQSSVILLFGEAGKYTSWLKKMHPVEEIPTKSGFAIQIYKNVWAKPQTVLRLRFGRDIEPAEILAKGGAAFIDSLVYRLEVKQGLPGSLSPNTYTDSVSKLISNNYGFTFRFPPQFRLAMSNHEIVWLHQETPKFYRDIFVNIFSDSAPLNSLEEAVANRDLFSKRYIKNAEGTDIKVSRSSLFPLHFYNATSIGKYKVKILRGWYQEEGTFRRGPFVRYFFHDPANKRYIAMDGFLYAPEMERLPFYRLFDLVAGTMELPK